MRQDLQEEIAIELGQWPAEQRVDVQERAGIGADLDDDIVRLTRDEQRADFMPTLWIPDHPRITQLLFAGAHGDVGGGYPTTDTEAGCPISRSTG